ncbi:hypothetical protein GEMRC1_007954 [Eukaryota sp. GEM-RC1]
MFPDPNSRLSLLFFNYLFTFFEGKTEKTIYYAEKVDPLKFLSHAVYLKRLVEDSCTGVTANNPFPLTKSLIPNHIRLDTTWFKKVYASEIKGSFDDVRKDIWHSVLKPKFLPKSLSHDFKYSSISTDGVSCSLMMMRKDLLDGRGNPHKKVKAVDYTATERYIDSLSSTEIQNLNLKSKRIVAIDPNQHDLMYCASLKSKEEKKIEGFDTSANLRRRKICPKSSKKKGSLKKLKKELKDWKDAPTIDKPSTVKLKNRDNWKVFRYTAGERNADIKKSPWKRKKQGRKEKELRERRGSWRRK